MTIPNRQIEMGEKRTFEDFRLASCPPSRVREVAVVGSAYDSIMASGFTYVSTPITSGAVLYEAMDAAGVTSPDELRRDRDLFRQTVMEPNFRAAEKVARTMLSFGGAVIAPAAFEARSLDWDQDAYMGLWLDTIERKATRIAMVDGWEYSNGGVEEYLQALLMQGGRRDRSDIEIVDARADTIDHHDAIVLLANAVDRLMTRGFSPVTLVRTLHRTIALHGMIAAESDYGIGMDRCGRTVFRVSDAYRQAEDQDAIRTATRQVRDVLAPALKLLNPDELDLRSSGDMAPGLVRNADRAELSETPASVQMMQEKETD